MFLILIGLGSNHLRAQQFLSDSSEIKTINSSVKFMGFVVPWAFGPYGAGLSMAYEHKIAESKVLTLGGFYGVTGDFDSDLAPSKFQSLKIGYRRYRSKSLLDNPVFWTEKYLLWNYTTNEWNRKPKCEYTNIYGVGYAVGIRLFFSYKRAWFIDFGLGASLGWRVYKTITSTILKKGSCQD